MRHHSLDFRGSTAHSVHLQDVALLDVSYKAVKEDTVGCHGGSEPMHDAFAKQPSLDACGTCVCHQLDATIQFSSWQPDGDKAERRDTRCLLREWSVVHL
jgi:hypothetical protein